MVLPLLGGGTPPDIKLGQFQTLQKTIAAKQISSLDAQIYFQKLTAQLSPQERITYKNSINAIIETAQKQGIVLNTDNNKQPAPITEPIKITPQKPEIAQSTLTPDQLTRITDAIKVLMKTYKKESLDILEKALAKIKTAIGTAQVPKNIIAALTKIDAFKKQLADDLAFITTLGKEVLDKELPELKNKLQDPKALKESIVRIGKIEQDIKEFLTLYKNNTNVELVVNSALKNLTQSVYTLLQQSMVSAAQIKDAATVRKLIRVYAHGVDQFPAYSATSLAKQAIADLLKNNRETLTKLTTQNFYATIDPKNLEQQLAPLEEYAYLFADHEREQLKTIQHYLEGTLDHQQWLTDVDKEIEKTKKFIASKPTNTLAIDERIGMLLASYDDVVEIFKTQKEIGGKWLPSTLQSRLTPLGEMVIELEKLLATAEELEQIEAFSKTFESENLNPTKMTVEFSESPVTPALKLEKLPESQNLSKINAESEQRDKELAQQRLESLKNE